MDFKKKLREQLQGMSDEEKEIYDHWYKMEKLKQAKANAKKDAKKKKGNVISDLLGSL